LKNNHATLDDIGLIHQHLLENSWYLINPYYCSKKNMINTDFQIIYTIY